MIRGERGLRVPVTLNAALWGICVPLVGVLLLIGGAR